MSSGNLHRNSMIWLTDLQKAKAEGQQGVKPKVTIQDLLERINDPNAPEQALIPTSPRSVEACFRLGIDPVDLQYHPPLWYARKDDADYEVSKLRYERNEAVRQERLRALIEARKHLIDEGWQPTEAGKGPAAALRRESSERNAASSAMVEKERQRLEVLKRRQERDLQQLVAYEVSRKELLDRQQKRVEEMEKRSQELIRQRQENEVARMNKQREIELQKAAEEKENERRARIMAEERYKHEKKVQEMRREEERQLKRKAFQEDMERRRKAEEARKETEAILAAQAEEVRLRKLEMEKRDVERAKRMQEEVKMRAVVNADKRKKADARIMSALEQNAEILRRKRAAYEAREAEAARRRQELDEIRAREEERKRQEEVRKEQQRQDKYAAALETEEMRRSSIKARADEKERMLAELYARRKKEHDLRKVEQEFQLKLRLDKVDSIQKTNLYHRQQLLEKIMQEYEKTRSMMRERQDLQEQRKMANMHASLQRHAMTQVMDSLRATKNVSMLTGSGGGVNINELLAKTRPATAM